MSESGAEIIPNQAKTKERKHDWLGAIDQYTKAESAASPRSLLEVANVFEKTGYASYRATMQAESDEESRTRCSRAIGKSVV